MEVLMARFSRSRTSRTLVSIIVLAITVGAAFQFRRLKKVDAQTPPLQMPVAQPVQPAVLVKTKQLPATPAIAVTPAVKTLVTQTPDANKPSQGFAQTKQAPSVPAAPVLMMSAAPMAANTPATPGALFSDASAKVAAGDLVTARTEFNNALLSGTLSATDTDAVKKQMSAINQTLIFSPRQFPKDPLGGVYQVKSGDRLAAIGNSHLIPYELLLPINRMSDARKLRYGQMLKVINGPFHAIVTKSKFTLDVYLGSPGGPDSTYITTFAVGLGTDNSTPTGTWAIKNKVTHPAYFPPEGHEGPVLNRR